MKPVKRIEIVIDAAHTPALLDVLKEADAPGHTLVRDVHGSGDRGDRTGDHLTEVFRNCLIIVACPPEQCESLVEAVRPLLRKFGGICLVSDAQWLRH
ncbi:MAG: transcriptional regulator [Verrucomicrobiota bacterium]